MDTINLTIPAVFQKEPAIREFAVETIAQARLHDNLIALSFLAKPGEGCRGDLHIRFATAEEARAQWTPIVPVLRASGRFLDRMPPNVEPLGDDTFLAFLALYDQTDNLGSIQGTIARETRVADWNEWLAYVNERRQRLGGEPISVQFQSMKTLKPGTPK